MKFTVLTLFPDIVKAFFENSIMAKAVEKEIIAYDLVNIRDFSLDKHHTCDDGTYGGGAGQLMLAEPLGRALDSVNARKKCVIYVTPSGKPFTQKLAQQLSHKDELVFICGRYEGIDQRIIDSYVDMEISIGDYVMSSGEIAATVVIDTVYRLIDGVISHESLEEESYCDGLLEYPQYTRPPVYKEMEVPPVLLSGNHEEIRKWRLKKKLMKTILNRPDLICEARKNCQLTEEAEKMIGEITEQSCLKNKIQRKMKK
ncbi:MAG: tRNA (guanosine(37)-N1)-methyltransferase TrmD [Treponema sp.]|nr:tRNA (guanosine(37)-N1)-methyltransferase TrmD [Treponema sp.]